MATSIDTLQIEISAKADSANRAINRLTKNLDKLSTSLNSLNVGNVKGLDKTLKSLANISNVSSNGATNITNLARALATLSANANNIPVLNRSLSGLSGSLARFMATMSVAPSVNSNTLQMTQALAQLSRAGNNASVTASNLANLGTQLRNFMQIMSTAPMVNQNTIQMTNALANLASQGSRVGRSSQSLVSGLNRTDRAMRTSTKSAWSLARAFGKFYANYFLIIRGAKALWRSIEGTADYIEAYNYYNVAFGKIASEWQQDFARFGYDNAEAYADSFVGRMNETLGKLSGVQISVGADGKGLLADTGMKNLGLNIQEVTQYASQLASVTNSLGQTGETSLAISQSFTKLAGDISSLFNVDYSTVSKNLQSGLIGQSRALYKYGIDITNATLQTYAYELGLTKAVSEMTQAEKQQLRVLAILDQSKVSWGDLANTINSPSNMIRQLTTNLKETGMVLGQLFIPMFENVLPVVNGTTIAIKRLLTEIAGFFGVEINFNEFGQGYNELEEDNSDLSGSYDDLASSIEEVKSQLLGFDEVNKLSDTSATLSVGTEDNTIDLTDEIVSATEEYQKVWNEAFANMENTSQKWAGRIQTVLDGVGAVFEDFAIGDFFKAGEDTSQLVIDFNNFIADALKNVDWENIGSSFGAYMRGIKWVEVLISLKDIISEAWNGLWDAWFASLKESPFETLLITSIALMKVDSIRGALLEKLSGMTGLEIGKLTPLKIGAYAAVTFLGIEFAEDLGNIIGEYIAGPIVDPMKYISMGSENDAKLKEITDKYTAFNDQVARYIELSGNYESLSSEDKSWVKQMGEDLKKAGIVEGIDDITGAWTGTKEELEKVIKMQMNYIKLQANEEFLTELYKQLTELENKQMSMYKEYGEKSVLDLIFSGYSDWNDIEAIGEEIDMLRNLIRQTESQSKYFENQIHETGDSLNDTAYDANNLSEEVYNLGVQVDNMPKRGHLTLSADKTQYSRIVIGATKEVQDFVNNYGKTTTSINGNEADLLTAIGFAGENMDNFTEAYETVMSNLDADDSGVTTGTQAGALTLDEYEKKYGTITTRFTVDTSGITSLPTLDIPVDLDTSGVKITLDELDKLIKEKFPASSKGLSLLDPLGLGSKIGIKKFASGGFVDEGQLFIAREAGPELVGSMGGHTAVANNQQITDGIARAVYSAFTSALSTTNHGSSGDIIVNIDGKQVFKAVQKQATNYVAQTGQTPFPI